MRFSASISYNQDVLDSEGKQKVATDLELQFATFSNDDKEKYLAARASVEYVKPGMTVGLGSGSTAEFAVKILGQKVAEGLNFVAVSSSKKTAELAREHAIPLLSMEDLDYLDLYIDGADEVDPDLNLIKGGGGALLGEKIVAEAAGKVIIIVHAKKMVDALGAFPLPVEVIPFSKLIVSKRLQELGAVPRLRKNKDNGELYVTTEGNLILDCEFSSISSVKTLSDSIERIPGVVVQGFCLDMADMVIVGRGQSTEVLERSIKTSSVYAD